MGLHPEVFVLDLEGAAPNVSPANETASGISIGFSTRRAVRIPRSAIRPLSTSSWSEGILNSITLQASAVEFGNSRIARR